MSDLNTPNIGKDFNRIHNIITRGLIISIEKSDEFSKAGFPDDSTREGFLNYVGSLITVIEAHHQLEDELAFPNLHSKFPEAPYDLLESQHKAIVSRIEEAKIMMGELKGWAHENAALRNLREILSSISEIWHPHIKLEEEYFTSEGISEKINIEEQIKLSSMFSEYGREHAVPDFLIVPFMLFNLPADERQILAMSMPPIITEELVPKVWKEKWCNMMPFLLS